MKSLLWKLCLMAGVSWLMLFGNTTPVCSANENPRGPYMDPSPKITVELVTAAGSLIVAIFGLVTAGKAKQIALRAEEASKRSEQVRLRAIAAGEVLLGAMAELMVAAETVQFILSTRTEKALTAEETKQYSAPIAKAAGEVKKTMYSTALYTTHAIRESLDNLLCPVQEAKVGFSAWETFVLDLRAQHSEIAALFRDTYLK